MKLGETFLTAKPASPMQMSHAARTVKQHKIPTLVITAGWTTSRRVRRASPEGASPSWPPPTTSRCW